jgi:hypothetical protein
MGINPLIDSVVKCQGLKPGTLNQTVQKGLKSLEAGMIDFSFNQT